VWQSLSLFFIKPVDRPRDPVGLEDVGEAKLGPVQRDLYSAYLAGHVRDGSLSTESVRDGWSVAESLLREAVERIQQTVSGKVRPASFGC